MKKKVTGIVLAITVLFSLAGCNNDAMQTKIDELEAKIEEQDEALSNLQEENAELETIIEGLQKENAAQTEALEALKNANKTLRDQIWEVEYNKILKEFDLTDSKVYWQGTINDSFFDDKVLIVFRHTSTFPELKLFHFNFENAESMEYLALCPPEHYYQPGREDWVANFTQIASITLKEKSKEKVVEAIKYFESLEIIKSASPDISYDMN